MSVLFDEALDDAVRAVEAAGVDLTGCEATLLRDLRGLIRLHLRSPTGRWAPDAKTKLKDALKRSEPFGTEIVYLEANGSDFPLASILDAERVPFAPSGTTPIAKWFKLERRFSKDAWLTETGEEHEPWPFAEGTPVVSFYAFKGGVGRSTALTAFALYLCETINKNVVVVDLDLESPGLGSLLLNDPAVDLGVVDFLLESRVARTPPLPLTRFAVGSPFGTGTGSIRVIPAGKLDSAYLEKLGRVDVQNLVEPGKPLREPLLRLLQLVRDELRPDAILLDVRAGLHDLGGVSLSGLSHLELIFGVHSPQTWAGLPLVLRHLGYLRAPWIKLVHTMVPPRSRGGNEVHEQFVSKAYNLCSELYYEEGDIPELGDESAAHNAFRLPYTEALLGVTNAAASRQDLLADEHRLFCEQLAKYIGLEAGT